MKQFISEENAAAFVLDSVFKQADQQWPEHFRTLNKLLMDAGFNVVNPEFAKFNFTMAAIALNGRAAFDIFPRDQAERLFAATMRILEKFLGDGFPAVKNLIVKYNEAYNNGIMHIRNPALDVGTLLYYKMGFDNTEQKVVDERYYAAAPKVVEYLVNALIFFTGKWEIVNERYKLKVPSQPRG